MDNLILNSLDINKFESHEYLLEVLPLLEEATQRLGSPAATKTWLLTPALSLIKKHDTSDSLPQIKNTISSPYCF